MKTFVMLLTVAVLACWSDRLTQPDHADVLRAATSDSGATILIGAGDIAGCGTFYRDEATARTIARVIADTTTDSVRVFTAGDNAYPYGTAADFACYNASWGAFKERTWFTIGNHEHHNDVTAKGYYDYVLGVGADSGAMGRRGKGYYAADYGRWRLYFLNSEFNIAEQTAWLKADMDANPRACQLMVFHRPLYTTGGDDLAPARNLRAWHMVFWRHRGDIVLNGHSHYYRRTTTIRPDTTPGVLAEKAVIDTATGFRVFIEGGGGQGGLTTFGPDLFYDQKRIRAHGVLKLALRPTTYRWERLDTLGAVVDQGSRGCH